MILSFFINSVHNSPQPVVSVPVQLNSIYKKLQSAKTENIKNLNSKADLRSDEVWQINNAKNKKRGKYKMKEYQISK